MNLIPKANVWVMKAGQMMRMSSTAGSSGASGSDGNYGWIPGEHRDILGEKPFESKKTRDASKDNEPSETPKNFTNPHHESPVLEAPACDPLYMMGQKKAVKFSKHEKGVINKEIVENLRSYFDDQIIYYKTMANYNKSAMKRIKKVKKNWNKILE